MSDVALLVAESPWFMPKDNFGQASGLPFFEGVKKILNSKLDDSHFNIYHSNFYDDTSLEQALDFLVQTRENKQILYLGGHGDGEYIADASIDKASDLIRDRGNNIKGLILSSCWGGKNDKVAAATQFGLNSKSNRVNWVNGPNWVLAYRYPVLWFESAMIETSIVYTMANAYMNGRLNSRQDILNKFIDALRPFSIEDIIGQDDETNKWDVSVKDTIRVWIRPQGSDIPSEVTESLFSELSEIQNY
ncbi:hypothetical protein [Methylotuvimicrobium buryatense]|uniref:CHAT domain-containing protein n=1 Tax=Methylotuvimicrobium buryatense TaxID=95641 RepID=A0A4P9UJD3_METBY|nr:hypothetical protein [Methylotuvimicrobium buryatense]QCW81292.1 hypothetical protein EQU24_02770 [Methylotuvimicrobium buryatense]